MNLMELILQLDARLRQLWVADESGWRAVLDEVAAGPRPEGVAPDVEPRAVLAGQLSGIEHECRGLRERLGVELTVVAHVEVHVTVDGPADTGPAPAGPNEPD